MRAERLVQARIVGLEMAAKPGVEPRRQVLAARRLIAIEFIHQAKDLIEQPLVIEARLKDFDAIYESLGDGKRSLKGAA